MTDEEIKSDAVESIDELYRELDKLNLTPEERLVIYTANLRIDEIVHKVIFSDKLIEACNVMLTVFARNFNEVVTKCHKTRTS